MKNRIETPATPFIIYKALLINFRSDFTWYKVEHPKEKDENNICPKRNALSYMRLELYTELITNP